MSLEVVAAGAAACLPVLTVEPEELRAMSAAHDSRVLTPSDSSKLRGCRGWPLSRLLEIAAASLGRALHPRAVGVFTASDGLQTAPIALDELRKGVLLHTAADGAPLGGGGPIRLWFPAGVAVQRSRCGHVGPADVKGVRRLELREPASAERGADLSRTQWAVACGAAVAVAGLALFSLGKLGARKAQ